MPRSLEAIARAKRNYLLRHPERRKATIKKYYAANKERECARKRKWEQENAEHVSAYRRQYRRGNQLHISPVLDWQKRNPEKVRAYKANTRARRAAVVGRISVGLAPRLFALQNGRCAYCRQGLRNYHLDHIMPLARGGKNEDGNMQLLCRLCNQRKSSREPVEFAQSLGMLL